MEKIQAEKILQQKHIFNILEEYEKHISKSSFVLKRDKMNEMLNRKKIILKDTDLNFSKKIEYVYGNENKEYNLFVGKCARKTFFEWGNSYNQDPEYVKISQINESMKKTFIDFLESQNLIQEKNVEYVLNSNNFEIYGTIDAIYKKGSKSCLLHFESIKNNYFVKDNEDVKGMPMQRHLIKIIPSMIRMGLPLTFVYQDRGTMELNKYEISLDSNFNIYINGIIYEEFNLQDIIQNINKLHYEVIVQNSIPERSYKKYKKEDLFILSKKRLISKKESDEIFANLTVYPFDCNKCVFKNICDTLPENSFSR